MLAQLAIDSAKRRFDINIEEEISRIKSDMDINKNKYPIFWTIIRPGFNKNAENILKLKKKVEKMTEEEIIQMDKYGDTKEEIIKNLDIEYNQVNKINNKLKCPMNYLYDIKVANSRNSLSTLPMSYFFEKHSIEASKRRTCKKVEDLIQKYSLEVYNARTEELSDEDYLLLRADFENLVKDLQQISISKNYLGLMSWLIDRAFIITPSLKRKRKELNSTLDKNKSLFIKTLYEISSENFLKCFKPL